MAKNKKPRRGARQRASLAATPEEAAAVFDVMKNETDRGLVLAMESMISDVMEIAIRAKFKKDSIAADEEEFNAVLDWLLIKEPLPPLGSFGVKINALYALGMINEQWKSGLHEFREIRNQAAHGKKAFQLGDYAFDEMLLLPAKSERELLSIFETAIKEAGQSPSRPIFQFCASFMFLRLIYVAHIPDKAREILADDFTGASVPVARALQDQISQLQIP